MQLTEKNCKDMRDVRGLCNILSANLGNAIPLAPENCKANASAVSTSMTTASKLYTALEVMLMGVPLSGQSPGPLEAMIAGDSTDLIPVKGHDLYTAIKYLRALATGQMGDAGGNALPQHVQFVLGKISDRFATALTAGPSEKWPDENLFVNVAAVDKAAHDIKIAIERGFNDDEATHETVAANVLNILDAASGEGYYSRAAAMEAARRAHNFSNYAEDANAAMLRDPDTLAWLEKERASKAGEIPFVAPAPQIRWNYDRFVNGVKMAEGIAVHARDIDGAQKAVEIITGNSPEGETFVFRDNEPCASRCSICYPATKDHKPNHGDSAHAAEYPLAALSISELPKGVDPAVLLRDEHPAEGLLRALLQSVELRDGGRYVITSKNGSHFQVAIRVADEYFQFKAREAARKAKSNVQN